MTTADWLEMAAKIGLWLALLLQVTPVMLWIERRVPALMQDRLGPNRVGPLGLLQAIADVGKFIFKEDFSPRHGHHGLYLLAPILALVPCMTTYMVLPFGPDLRIGEQTVRSVVIESDHGVFLLLALGSLGVYSLVLAGWASNNKWSTLGAIRASAQLISYELALALAILGAVLPAASLNLQDVVLRQSSQHVFGFLPAWGVALQPLGFLVFLVAMFAETNRLPFDLPEAESELVAGYHTEYGSMRFALFFMGEYMNMAILSGLAATLYFGGWTLPGVDLAGLPGVWPAVAGMGVLWAKISLFLFLFVWVRWTFPRFRYDQLMRLGWKVLLPLALVNLLWVAGATLLEGS